MKTTVFLEDFQQLFQDYGRNDNFSAEGQKALFDYLKQIEEDTGTQIEIDIIAICCEYTEYDSIEEALEETGAEDQEELEDNTIIIEVPGTEHVIIGNF